MMDEAQMLLGFLWVRSVSMATKYLSFIGLRYHPLSYKGNSKVLIHPAIIK